MTGERRPIATIAELSALAGERFAREDAEKAEQERVRLVEEREPSRATHHTLPSKRINRPGRDFWR